MGIQFRRFTPLLYIALLCSVFAALFAGQQDPISIIIADGSQPGFGLVYIAGAENYFKDEGLSVTFRKFNTGKDALDDLLKGNADFATSYETPVIHLIYSGVPVTILTTLHYSNSNTRLVANKARGISTPDNLRGKTIATSFGRNPEYFLDTFLEDNGIEQKDVKIINAEPDKIPELLETGKVDAATIWNIAPNTLQSRTKDPLIEFNSNTFNEISLLVTKPILIKNRDTTTVRILKALVKAKRFYTSHKAESLQILTNRFPNMSPDDVEYTFNRIVLDARLDNLLITNLTSEAEFYKQSGLYHDPIPQFKNNIDAEKLREADPLLVTIF